MHIKIVKYIVALLLLLLIANCDESINDLPKENKKPETSLFLFTDSTIAPQPSKIKISWWADDPDGLIVGYYYKWNGSDWEFTKENEILFALQIGASDTLYQFEVAGVDNNGNGIYDNSIVRNGIEFGPEPFEDINNDGIYNTNEKFYDIGDIDPTPAKEKFPIKNSAPIIEWNDLTSLPSTSFPAMTIGWNVDDLDGIETITSINIAINDSLNTIKLNGAVRNITFRTNDYISDSPLMEILINGNLSSKKLSGIKLNANNVIYVQAEDISGAKSNFIKLPNEENKSWFVKKPKGKVLLLDDNTRADNSSDFYSETLNNLKGGSFTNKYDVWDLHKEVIPYENITFFETIKLYDAIVWYSDNQPNIDLASATIKKYIENGGKVIFTSVLPHPIDVIQLQDFLPIDSLAAPLKFLGSNIIISSDSSLISYPELKTSSSSIKVQTFYPSEVGAQSLYNLPEDKVKGSQVIALKSKDNKIFFFGLPLHECDGNVGNVNLLFDKILFEEFGLSL